MPIVTLALLLILAATAPGVPVHVTPDNVVYHAAPPPFPAGAQLAVLEGKPGEQFPYALRLRLPAGAALAQSTRAKPASVTVLSGSVTVDGLAFPAGSYFTITPFAGDLVAAEESVVQVSGDGPWLKGALDAGPSVEATIPVHRDDADLQLVDATPPSGSEVSAETVAHVRVRYSVRNFQPNMYRIEPMFESTRAGSSVGVPTTNPAATTTNHTLSVASGEMTLDIPVALLARTQAARPLHMWIFLLRKTGEHSSRPLVRTPPVIFNMK
jgi:hypothetical protein